MKAWFSRNLLRLPLARSLVRLKQSHFKQQELIASRVSALEQAARSSLETDAAVLQACRRIIDTFADLRQQQADSQSVFIQPMQTLLAEIRKLVAAGEEGRASTEGVRREVLANVVELRKVVDERLSALESVNRGAPALRGSVDEMARVQQELLTQSQEIRRILGELQQPGRVRVVKTSDYALANPELGLMQHLYGFLPSRVALDIGAHVGEMSKGLVDAGYEVYAFEPFPPVFDALCERLGTAPGFHAASFAIGPADGEHEFQVMADTTTDKEFGDVTQFNSVLRREGPAGLVPAEEIRVSMRSLDSLWRTGELPLDVAIVKIDTEGFDLEVIRGMGNARPPVVIAEFWDPESMIGSGVTSNRLPDLVGEMRRRGYYWHIVMYRIDGSSDVSYFANRAASLPQSWGNVVFFQEYDAFAESGRWCAATLPATYFTAEPTSSSPRRDRPVALYDTGVTSGN